MQALLDWTLKAIRDEGTEFSWMEEMRFDWVPIARSAVMKITQGQTLLIVTDNKRRWFSRYIQDNINSREKNRPFIPIYDMKNCFSEFDQIKEKSEIEAMEDMLEISYPNGYFIWYIGNSGYNYTNYVYRNEANFLWLIGEHIQNSISFREGDPNIDIKLLQLYKLFDRTMEAILYGEVDPDI